MPKYHPHLIFKIVPFCCKQKEEKLYQIHKRLNCSGVQKCFTCCLKSIHTHTSPELLPCLYKTGKDANYRWSCLRAVLLVLRFLLVLLFVLARALFALAAARLLLALGQCLEASQEIVLPRLKVSLDAAVSAFHHVAVAFAAAHHAGSAQHPQPLVHVLANLEMDSA